MKRLRTALFIFLSIIVLSTAASAAVMFTTTVTETDIPAVQEAIINVFTPKGFAIVDLGPNKVELNKSFGDGFFAAIRNRTVIFTLIQQGENVRMMVAQNELNQGIVRLQNNIDHLIPLIREVRNSVDGTPPDRIVNDTPAPGEKEKELEETIGLTLKAADGGYTAEVAGGESAAKAGLQNGDLVLEINGKALSDMKEREVENYIAEKWDAGSSIIVLYERDGNKDLLTLKKDKTSR